MKPRELNHDFPVVVATMPINQRNFNLALIAVIVLLVGTLLCWAPFASVQLARIDAFIPVIQSLMCVADLLTATILFSQYAVQPKSSLLMLAGGYIAGGLFAFLQTLAFPGSYATTGLFGDGIDTPAWLFVLWHTSFPLGVILYALSKDGGATTSKPGRWSGAAMIAITVATVGTAVVALTWIITTAAGYLPSLYASSVTRQTLAANYTNAILGLWYATALGLLFLRKRTILDLWLIVTLVAWVPNFLLAAIVTSVRFSLGWYSARVYALIASWTLLIVLLTETTVLYARLANALTLRKRERADRLLSVDAATAALAHELGSPLGSIAMNAATALMYLRAKPPSFKDINQLLEDIEAQSHRVGRIISSVRAMFFYTTDKRVMIHMEDVARQVLILLRDDLRDNNIVVITDFRDDLPQIHADHTQIQQVILNLVNNAVEAMGSNPGTKHLRLATSLAGTSTVVLSIKDSGGGISRENQERIFDAFFTTKPAGMGLGLAICRTIVENHGGSLQIAKSDSDGSVFEVAMPTGPWQPH